MLDLTPRRCGDDNQLGVVILVGSEPQPRLLTTRTHCRDIEQRRSQNRHLALGVDADADGVILRIGTRVRNPDSRGEGEDAWRRGVESEVPGNVAGSVGRRLNVGGSGSRPIPIEDIAVILAEVKLVRCVDEDL